MQGQEVSNGNKEEKRQNIRKRSEEAERWRNLAKRAKLPKRLSTDLKKLEDEGYTKIQGTYEEPKENAS